MTTQVKMIDKPNINRGKPYELRVCVGCNGKCRDLSNYCQSCFDILKTEMLNLKEEDLDNG